MEELTHKRRVVFPSRLLKAVSVILVAMAVVLVYAPSLKSGYILDDSEEVTDLAGENIHFLDIVKARPFRAITAVTYRLDYLIAGRASEPHYHLMNLFFHFLAMLALMAFWREAAIWSEMEEKRAWWVGTIAGAVFLWHPLNIEAVSYISARGYIIAAMLIFWGLRSVFRMFRGSFSIGWYFVSLLSICMALFCNEAAAVGPVLVIVLYVLVGVRQKHYNSTGMVDGAFLPREGGPTRMSGLPSGERHGIRIAFLLPYALVLIVWVAFRLTHHLELGLKVSSSAAKWSVATPFWAMGMYARMALWPFGLSLEHGSGPLGKWDAFGHILLGAIAVISGFVAIYYGWRSRSRIEAISSFAAFWWVAALFVVIAVPLVDAVAERRAYIAMGAVGLMPFLAMFLFERRHFMAKPVICLELILILLWGVSAERYIIKWGKPISLWENAVKWQPASARAWDYMGIKLFEVKNWRGSRRAFETAVAIAPSLPWAEHNLAVSIAMMGDLDTAAKHFEKAIGENPDDWRLLTDYGTLETERGNYKAAEMRIKQALLINNGEAAVWLALGNLLRREGEFGRAKDAYLEAVKRDPGHLDARINLALVLADIGDVEAARKEVAKVMAAEPEYKPAFLAASQVEYRAGNMGAAVKYLTMYDEAKGRAFEETINQAAKLKQMGKDSEAQTALDQAAKVYESARTGSKSLSQNFSLDAGK